MTFNLGPGPLARVQPVLVEVQPRIEPWDGRQRDELRLGGAAVIHAERPVPEGVRRTPGRGLRHQRRLAAPDRDSAPGTEAAVDVDDVHLTPGPGADLAAPDQRIPGAAGAGRSVVGDCGVLLRPPGRAAPPPETPQPSAAAPSAGP